MKLPEIGVKRPTATAMLFVAIILLGIVANRMLPLDLMPTMEFPSVTVITVYPGASANEVEEQVTKPLEAVLAAAENLKELNSTSKENVSFIQLSYEWGSDITSATNSARDLIELAKSELPAAAKQPVIYKINSSMLPVLIYAVNAEEHYDGMEHIVEDDIASPIRKVEGVGTVVYLGQPEREIKVNIDPQRMAAYGLSASQVSVMLQANNINVPAGNINMGVYDFSVRMPAKFESVEEIENTVLKAFNGQVVRLKDVASVEDSFKDKEAYARNHIGEGVALIVQKQSGANTVDVANAVRNEMDEIRKTLPADMQVFEVIGSDEIIVKSVDSLTSTIWDALIFVTLIVLLFLREWKSSLIIFVTMPVSLISAFIAMYLMDYTINVFSLMSMVIAIGMVVDNAIVVLENITQHRERGMMPREASIFGTSEMGMAISASTLTTIVVFLPLIFMRGIVGIMFKQLAILTSITMIMSLFTALTLTPMMSSQLLKDSPLQLKNKRRSKFYIASEKIFEKIENVYRKMLGWVVFHKGITLIAALVIFIISLVLFRTVGTDYIPDFDAGTVSAVFKTEVGSTASRTDSVAQQILQIMQDEIPEMQEGAIAAISGQTSTGVLTTVGFKEGKNIGTVICRLVPIEERKRSSTEIADAIRGKIEAIPQIEEVTVHGGSAMATALGGNKAPIEILVSGNDLDQISGLATQFEEKMRNEKFFTGVSSTVDQGKMEVLVEIDKDKASQLALNATLIGAQIRQNLYGAESGDYTEEGKNYEIVIRYAPDFRNEVSKLRDMQITNLLGQSIPLSTVAEITEKSGPLEIQRRSQQRYVKATAELDGISLGEASEVAQQIIDSTVIPEGVDVKISGKVMDQSNSFQSLAIIFLLGITLVFMVMAAQFESFKDPFIILFSLPFMLVGVVLTLLLTRITLSVVTIIGIIMLVGIVVNNGIVLVDYTNLLRKRGYMLRDAVMEAGRSRLRPVLMTSLTTILGMLPMALSTGMGHELFAPLGATIIGGLLISMLTTLLIVPAMYTTLNNKVLLKDREIIRKRKQIGTDEITVNPKD